MIVLLLWAAGLLFFAWEADRHRAWTWAVTGFWAAAVFFWLLIGLVVIPAIHRRRAATQHDQGALLRAVREASVREARERQEKDLS